MRGVKAERKVHAVLDSSAVLAYLKQEQGYTLVREAIQKGASISTVNFSEVLTKVVEKGADSDKIATQLLALGLVPQPFTEADARQAAQIYPATRSHGLSLGDRACLSLALRLDIPALTADKIWAKLGHPFRIVILR
jgi:PIN domain nuclease of toxin-antitoxin system